MGRKSKIHSTVVPEYNRILDFKNHDLEIHERKHASYSLLKQVLSLHPNLAHNVAYAPEEALIDFFDEKRDELDTHPEWSPAEKDRREILFLGPVEQDLRLLGPHSVYIRQLLGK